MTDFKKKLILGLAALTLLMGTLASAQSTTAVPNFFKRSGNAITTLNSAWELGSSSSRIAKGWFTALDTTTLTLGGAVTGDVHVNDDAYVSFGNTYASPDAKMGWNTAQTVDGLYIATSTGQNTAILAEIGDVAFDFAHGAATNPTLFIHSATQSTTEYLSLAHNQTNGVILTGAGDLVLNIAGANLIPSANDAWALGVSGTGVSDIFLASGAVINIAVGDITATHSSNTLAFAGGTLYSFDDEVQIDKATAGPALDVNVSATTYTSSVGSGLDIVRSGAITGVAAETMHDFKAAPSFTLTEPASGNFIYEGGTIDMTGVSVTAGAGTSVLAGLRIFTNTDTDAFNSFAILVGTPDVLATTNYNTEVLVKQRSTTGNGIAVEGVSGGGNAAAFAVRANSSGDIISQITFGGAYVFNGTGVIIGGSTGAASTSLSVDSNGTTNTPLRVYGRTGLTADIAKFGQTSAIDTLKFDKSGNITATPVAETSGTQKYFLLTAPASTGQTAATEAIGMDWDLDATKTWAAGVGPLAAQREVLIRAPTYSGDAGGALTITDTATVYISGAPIAGTNMTLTNTNALWIDAGAARFDGRVLKTQGADVASATNLTLGTDGNSFEITGTTKIDLISNVGWKEGSEVTLITNESVTIDHGTATSGTNAQIRLAGADDFAMTAGDTLTLILSSTTAEGQAWREKTRSAI